ESLKQLSQPVLGESPAIRQWPMYSAIIGCGNECVASRLEHSPNIVHRAKRLPCMLKHFSTHNKIKPVRTEHLRAIAQVRDIRRGAIRINIEGRYLHPRKERRGAFVHLWRHVKQLCVLGLVN